MRRLFFTPVLFLAFFCMQAQEMYIKKETSKTSDNWELYKLYNYDETMKLISTFLISQSGDTIIKNFYENERLKHVMLAGLDTKFEYQGDSVLELREQWDGSYLLSTVFFLNGAHQVTESKLCDNLGNYIGSIDYDWEMGNCVNSENSIGGQEFMEYDNLVRNPYYNENKYFKRSFLGSLNQLTFGQFLTVDYTFTIISTENEYPTEIEFSDSNGDTRTLYYEYHDPSGIGDGLQAQSFEVLSVNYYNLLGQEIQKPEHGFYIEIKITSKGISGKQFFIQ